MSRESMPKSLLVFSLLIVLGVFSGNQWISQEIEEAGQLPLSAVSAVSAVVPQAKDVRTGGQDLVRSVSRIDQKKAQIEPPDPEIEQKKSEKMQIIYEKPLDTKEFLQ